MLTNHFDYLFTNSLATFINIVSTFKYQSPSIQKQGLNKINRENILRSTLMDHFISSQWMFVYFSIHLLIWRFEMFLLTLDIFKRNQMNDPISFDQNFLIGLPFEDAVIDTNCDTRRRKNGAAQRESISIEQFNNPHFITSVLINKCNSTNYVNKSGQFTVIGRRFLAPTDFDFPSLFPSYTMNNAS